MMVRTALALAALAVGSAMLVPQPAQAQARDKVLIIYGDDKCPTSNGEEIVVCARKPESERYRIPEELRESNLKGRNATWADRASSIEYVGRSGAGSCSPTGPGGATGCFNRMMRQAREENREKGQEPAVKF